MLQSTVYIALHANEMPFRGISFLIVDLLIKIKTFVTYYVDF